MPRNSLPGVRSVLVLLLAWGMAEACERTVRWYRARAGGASADELARLCLEDIAEHAAASC